MKDVHSQVYSPKQTSPLHNTHTRTHARTGHTATQHWKLVSRFVQIKVCVVQFALKHFFPCSVCSELGNLHNIQQQKDKDYKANIFVGSSPRIFLRLIFASENQNSIETDLLKASWNWIRTNVSICLETDDWENIFFVNVFSFTFFCFLFLKTWIHTLTTSLIRERKKSQRKGQISISNFF